MSVARTAGELEPARRAAAIGTFDGVHLGHRRVIDAARAAGLRSVVVTFDPHPRTAFGARVELLVPLQRRIELLEAAGVDDVLVLRFDEGLASLSPQQFAADMLQGAGIEVVAAGDGFRFGRGRSGDLNLLRELGFDVRPVPLVDNVSSSHIRQLLHVGDVTNAAKLLGRPAEVEGIVVHGDHRGRLLGFPTANLQTPPDVLVPKLGIYAGAALGHRAAISIGTNPTYGGTERRAEAHLLDFDGDLYGQRLVVELWTHLRDEARFSSEAELVEAIRADCERTRVSLRP
ncbi:MAG TPA: riboflavin biosynthesis protein RibF [Gaiellaceae bacterium]